MQRMQLFGGTPWGMNEKINPVTGLGFSDARLICAPELTKKVARTSLSVSSAKTLKSCPARFAIEKIHPHKDTLFAPQVVGNAGHDVLEELMEKAPDQRTTDVALTLLDDLIKGTLEGHEALGELYPELESATVRKQFTDEVFEKIKGLWTIEDPASVTLYATEYEVKDVEIEGVPFRGYIDRIDKVSAKDGSEALRIIDYKTGKSPSADSIRVFGDDHGDQIRLYAIALERCTGLKVMEAYAYYTAVGVKRRIALGPQYRKATAKAHREAWDLHNECVESSAFPTTPSGLCSYCPLVYQCPYRAGAIKWDEVESKGVALRAEDFPINASGADEPSDSEGEASATGGDDDAVHTGVSSERTPHMTTFFESKPWDNDRGNLASYAHLSSSHLARLALRQIRLSGLPGDYLTPALIEASTNVLWIVVSTVQESLLNDRSLHFATSRNLIYMLEELLELSPMPIVVGNRLATTDEMNAWGARILAQLSTLQGVGIRVVTEGGDCGAAGRFTGGTAVVEHSTPPQSPEPSTPIEHASFDPHYDPDPEF